MNANSPPDMWASSAARMLADEKMEQVRELLFGEYRRQSELQLAAMDARLREMEAVLSRRIGELEVKVEALAGRSIEDRRGAFEELSRSVTELGQRIRDIAR